MNNSIPNPGSGPTNVDADNHDGGVALVSSSDGTQQIREEIPFLVTHWLANYGSNSSNSNDSNNSSSKEAQDREQMAIAKIRRATSEIASALNTLGAYGTTLRSSLEWSTSSSLSSSFLNQPVLQNRTFSDLNRMHAELPPSHLEHLAQSMAFNTATADITALENARTNYLLRVNSTRESAIAAGGLTNNSGSATGNRMLQEAFDQDTLEEVDDNERTSGWKQTIGDWNHQGQSILQNPTLIVSTTQQHDQLSTTKCTNSGDNSSSDKNKENSMIQAEREADQAPAIDVKSTHWEVAHQTAQVVRDFLTLREKCRSTENEIRSLEASMALQQAKANKLKEEIKKSGENSTITAVEKIETIERYKADHQGTDRVISQLARKLSELNSGQANLKSDVINLESQARSLDKRRRSIVHAFRDPFQSWRGSLSKNSRVGGSMTLQSVVGRELGLCRGRSSQKKFRSSLPTGSSPAHFLEFRKNLLATRLSHAVTINAHFNCPVYCLRFDRTGRYFITGADDFLLKVFYLGAAQSCKRHNGTNKNRRLRCNYGANFRGAVLVCTLKGHAGVINDINVSMDNCFLATASVDGDVRVWGLKNGCPVAILRGHKGGANMVSWSKLTPYRLVSTGSDGFARVWDIREACLKRYASMVNQRGEYNLRLTNEEKKAKNESQKVIHKAAGKSVAPDLLPPLPVRGESLSNLPSPVRNITVPAATLVSSVPQPLQPPNITQVAVPSEQPPSHSVDNNNGNDNENGIIVPPLPAAVPPLGQGADRGNQNGEGPDGGVAPGQFVANDLIDEGVKLLSKYQHGNIQEEQGPGTRSRRSAVNVICVARCPLGKQFVTGSDDGICRVWEDFDDSSVAIIDARLSNRNQETILRTEKTSQSGVESQPLLKLMGHVSTITDLAYSHTGDRILSASQKDGVVRVWNIGIPTATGRGDKIVFKDKRVTQIVIKLINPFSSKLSKPTRRRPGNAARNASSKVCCDVASWTHDDSYVLTSQSVLVKESGTDIQPGSLFICMWDSKSGRCLISISGAHTSQCQVVLPHPMDSSILCTASTDGFVKVWDWTQGKCIFTHRNKNESGGYLDGSFSPDGNTIVLTDDKGEITVLDSISKKDEPTNTGDELAWMREQYFANDYYDLAYDRNGYCIERGCERPPHLAPKSARCAQNGSAYSDEINESFKRLSGPSPLPENLCTWNREQIRAKRFSNKYFTRPFQEPSVRVSIREFDLLSTVVIRGVGHMGDQIENSKLRQAGASAFGSSSHPQGGETNAPTSTRAMSANYRYLDYDDLVRREGNPEEDEPDSDDEEFQPVAARRHVTNNEVESEDDDLDDLSIYSENNSSRRRRQRDQASSRETGERRIRAQRRAQRNDSDFLEIGSDDEMIAQFVSANRTPTGPYLRDYTLNGHYWRLKSTSDVNRVRRKWLHREESDTTYFGRNVYTPQMGDSVVYVPRAHFETIKECPSLSPPWQSWPMGAVWPVVRCFVRGIRFRFPYEDYFRNKQHAKCNSIVAILTLEVTGIPEISDDREFPWPKPSFIEPTRSFLFELSVFENSSCEYIIPETLYTSRITALENHIRSRRSGVAGLEVDLYYEQEQGDLDLQVWPATIEEILPDEGHSDVHLQGSGFGVVQVWDGVEQNRDHVSPWELNTEGVNLTRPCMSDNEKESVLQELNRLLRKDEIANHLSLPVDEERYCDYANMIEIPMDLMFIKRRLAANFYGSKLGAAADLQLIRDNCIKYNTTDNEMSEISEIMCKEFEQNILSDDERSQMISEEDFDEIHKEQSEGQQVSSMRIRLSARTIQEASQAAASIGGRYTLRDRIPTQGHSSLENLPAPDIGSTNRQRNRREGNTSDITREVNNLRSRGRNDETEVLGQVSRLRSTRRDVFAAGRSANDSINRRQRIPESHDVGSRRSTRTRNNQNSLRPHRSSAYRSNDNDRSNEEEIITTTHRSGTARRSSRGTISRNLQELQEGEDIENYSGSTVAIRDPRRVRSTRSRYIERQDDESEEDGAGEDEQPRENSDVESQYTDKGDNDRASSEESDLVDPSLPTNRSRTSRRTTRTPSRISEPAVESPGTRSSRRNATRKRRSYEEVESDEEEHFSDSEDSESSDVNRGRNSRISQPKESPGTRSSRRNTAKKRASYEEVESDAEEVESEEEEHLSDSADSESSELNRGRTSGRNRRSSGPSYTELESDVDVSEEEELSPPKRTPAKRKRQAGRSSNSSTTKKAKGRSAELPDLRKWPDIEVVDITQVTTEMLKRVWDDDTAGLFSKPVIEAHPAIADAYLNAIDTPMDLRTIEEDRVNVYSSIHMLQDDLILMFQNCCTFNGKDSDLGNMAVTQWEGINHKFVDVCKDLGILLPRHWNP